MTTTSATRPTPVFPLRWPLVALLVVAGLAVLMLSGYASCVQEETEQESFVIRDATGTWTVDQPRADVLHEMQVCFEGEQIGPPDQREDFIPSHALPVSIALVLFIVAAGIAVVRLPAQRRDTESAEPAGTG